MKSKYCPELIQFAYIKKFFIFLESLTFTILLKYIIALNKLKKTSKLSINIKEK